MINPAIIPLLAPLRKHKWSDSAMLAIYLQLLILADKDGCAFTSRRELSTLTGISQRKVWSTIRVLARCGLLTAECTAKGSIIKLCDTVSCRLQTKENEPQGVPLANQYPHRLQRIATDCNSKNYKTDQDHNDPPDAPLYKEKEKTERKEAKERKINKKKNFDFERERGAREEFLKRVLINSSRRIVNIAKGAKCSATVTLLTILSIDNKMNKLLLSALTLSGLCFLTAPAENRVEIADNYHGPKTRVTDTGWHPDVLAGYEARYVDQGEAFDGPCRSTIVRLKAEARSKRGFLYVHGFNDYFFQSEMGREFVDSGYHFYAVDLRRYGRSWEPWQYPFNIRKQEEYFADIDSALSQMRRDGVTDITLGGHSTGGLTVALYAAERGARVGVRRVVTDSPFLAWNFNATYRKLIIPAVTAVSKIIPNKKIKQGHCDGYAYSLLKEYHGQWTYDTDWKMVYSPPVTVSWIGAIEKAQRKLMKNAQHIAVPILVMHSSRKISGCNWTPEFQKGDAVLDPEMLQQRGVKLGKVREVATIDDGLHDLILSEPTARKAAYDTIFSFIRRHP